MPEPLFDDEPVIPMPKDETPATTVALVEPPEIAHLKPFNPGTLPLASIQLDRSGALPKPRDLLEQRELLEDACRDMEAHGEAWYAAALEFRAHVEQAVGGSGMAAVVGEVGYQLLNTMAKEQKAARVAFDVVVLIQCALCLKLREMAETRR